MLRQRRPRRSLNATIAENRARAGLLREASRASPDAAHRSAKDRAIRCGSDAPDRVRFALPGCVAVANIGSGHGESVLRTEGVFTVKTLKFWASPAVLVALWIIAAAFTLSQLATVSPSLLSTGVQPPRLEEQRDPAA